MVRDGDTGWRGVVHFDRIAQKQRNPNRVLLCMLGPGLSATMAVLLRQEPALPRVFPQKLWISTTASAPRAGLGRALTQKPVQSANDDVDAP